MLESTKKLARFPELDHMVKSILGNLLEGRIVSRVIYGTVFVLALITILEDHPPDNEVRIIGTLVLTVLTVFLAESLAHLMGQQIDLHRRLSLDEVVETVKELSAVTLSVTLPAVLFVFSILDFISLQAAFTLSKTSSIALLLIYGYVLAGRRVEVGMVA